MIQIKSEQIKILRDKTGAGIMDCKSALIENSGDMEKSITWLRKKGIASANKKSSRQAAEGLVGISINNDTACILEVNAETDFVSKNEDFQKFIKRLLIVADKKIMSIQELMSEMYDSEINVQNSLNNLIAKIGENIVIRRLQYLSQKEDNSFFSYYIHNKVSECLGKIVSMVLIKSNNQKGETRDLAKKISMQISATKPVALKKEQIKQEIINKEKDIIKAQIANTNKPANVIDKIVDGKISKFISEISLLEQNWIMDTAIKVKEVIEKFNNETGSEFEILDYRFLVLGDGIEVIEKNFQEEVKSQL